MLERFTRETREVVRRAAKITESEQAATDAGARHISPRHLLVAIAGAAGRARRQRRGTPPDRKRSLIEPKPAVRQPVRRPSPKCR